MTKSRFIIVAGTALWLSGITMFLAGLIIYKNGPAQAQAQNTTYSSTWTVQDYLNCKSSINANNPTIYNEVTLGPNVWKVTGQASGQSFKETWTPTFGPIVETEPSTYNLCNTTYISPTQRSVLTTSAGSTPPGAIANTDIKNNGLYFTSTLGHANQGFQLIIFHIAGTYPTKWNVTGCIGTSCP